MAWGSGDGGALRTLQKYPIMARRRSRIIHIWVHINIQLHPIDRSRDGSIRGNIELFRENEHDAVHWGPTAANGGYVENVGEMGSHLIGGELSPVAV